MDPFATIPDFEPPTLAKIGDMTLDRERRKLSRGNKSVPVGGQYDVRFLLLFGKYPNQALVGERIRPAIWGNGVIRGEDLLRQYICRCRRSLRRLGSRCAIISHNFGTYEFVVPKTFRRD